MAVIKYKDPNTGEVKTVGAPANDSEIKAVVDAHTNNKNNPHGVTLQQIGAAPAYTYGTADLTAGVSSLETGKLYFVYE